VEPEPVCIEEDSAVLVVEETRITRVWRVSEKCHGKECARLVKNEKHKTVDVKGVPHSAFYLNKVMDASCEDPEKEWWAQVPACVPLEEEQVVEPEIIPVPIPIEPEIPDKCEGEACKCPEGMFGVQPFCEMCPPVTMQLCANGRELDDNGCETSTCLDIPDMCEGEACECPEGMFGVQPFCEMCPPVTMQLCPFGRVLDDNGCETSTCMPDILPGPEMLTIDQLINGNDIIEPELFGRNCKTTSCLPMPLDVDIGIEPELEELADGEIVPELEPVVMDRCEGSSCDCPPGYEGVQPFCREFRIAATLPMPEIPPENLIAPAPVELVAEPRALLNL